MGDTRKAGVVIWSRPGWQLVRPSSSGIRATHGLYCPSVSLPRARKRLIMAVSHLSCVRILAFPAIIPPRTPARTTSRRLQSTVTTLFWTLSTLVVPV